MRPAVAVLLSLPPLCLASAQSAPALHAGPTFHRVDDVRFAQGSSGPLLANLYLPEGNGPMPAIVFIHGGGWTNGDRTGFNGKLVEWLATRGYVGMVIDYDLSPAVHFPVALTECKEAVRWLRAHAATYHVDPQRIAVAGSSAGGELAALVALTGDDPRYAGRGAYPGISSAVQAAITYSADLDLTVFPDRDESILAYLGTSCADQKDLCRQASPQFQIGTHPPPFLVTHGDADRDVPYTQATSFVEAYRRAHGDVTFSTVHGMGHGYAGNPVWLQQNEDATLTFLKAHL